ncbi:nucleotidyl transferase AbiEii/AbiGii toxin family protein [Patescibacteria group bacterium]|nr:nucleotidyl transferase AbiEii/AbiGii toxin family protein [Patescibacteria group bacterium]MBU1015583.1 nucleotidyl transferase AbiEii/AbiGii toxin family protein [Patescibacteria group bacterium]MBU1684725.1 nucleotidyl transferase AbiEii/AbiGii toxin family protein [Patescibacteria group bacterium]MBU1938286.1 nucleotidyl transferase AbiEii/AbiGii toxin family protein [Patescibacteria group bacterium]
MRILMISLAELQEAASEWGLPMTTVERDYVLGWMLWAIGSHEAIKDKWIFKGGTCLKKCFTETWRFSEDLDFSLLLDSPFDASYLQNTIGEMQSRIQTEAGIDFSIMPAIVRLRPGNKSAEGKIYFRSLTGMSHSPLSIKLDLTIAEPIVTTPVFRKIQHAYSDTLPAHSGVLCYSFPELFAEKIRAMGERARPRDLYDIINLFWRNDPTLKREDVCRTLEKKCKNKNIPLVTFETVSASPFLNELKSEWGNMLRHQLDELPPYEHFWNALPEFFNWLHGAPAIQAPSIAVREVIDTSWTPPPTAFHWHGAPVEAIRFAAANHLCVKLGYQGTTRIIEPYAIQKTAKGNLILTAIKHDTRENRAYRIDRIESAEITQIPFAPESAILINENGPLLTPQIAHEKTRRRTNIISSARTVARPKSWSSGPTYIIECSWCHKKFRKKTYDMTIGKHKMKGQDYPCSGRSGWLVETKY